MSLSAVDEKKPDIFNVLSNHINKKKTATGIDYHGLPKVLDRTKKFISHAFMAERSDAEQREALAVVSTGCSTNSYTSQ